MKSLITTGLAVAAVAALAACGGGEDAPEPANETVAAEMPRTPDAAAATDAAAAADAAAAQAQGQTPGAAPSGAEPQVLPPETPPRQPAPEPTG